MLAICIFNVEVKWIMTPRVSNCHCWLYVAALKDQYIHCGAQRGLPQPLHTGALILDLDLHAVTHMESRGFFLFVFFNHRAYTKNKLQSVWVWQTQTLCSSRIQWIFFLTCENEILMLLSWGRVSEFRLVGPLYKTIYFTPLYYSLW